MNREALAKKYVPAGARAIEIGPQNNPWPLPMRPTYVDKFTRDEQIAQRLPEATLVSADVIEDGATLPSFADGSVDAICASHVLEHMRDPIGALRRWVAALAPGGAILAAVPEKTQTFDVNREVTPYELLKAAHDGGQIALEAFVACQRADWFYRYDGRSWAASVLQAVEHAPTTIDIHFSVWDWQALRVFLDNTIRDYLGDVKVAEFIGNGAEVLFVLHKGDGQQ